MSSPKKNAAKTKAAKSEKTPVTTVEEKKEGSAGTDKPEVIAPIVTDKDVINNTEEILEKGEKAEIPIPPEDEFDHPVTDKEQFTKLSYTEAELLMNNGMGIKLPDWGGFWFKDFNTDKVHVLTKEGEILDNPEEEHKSSNEWIMAEPTTEQVMAVVDFLDGLVEIKEEPFQVSELTAVAFNRTKGGTFQKLKKEISFDKLSKREGLPPEVSRDSEILLSDGSVYDYEKQQITQQKAKI